MYEVADQQDKHEEQADHHGGVDHHEQVGEPAGPNAPYYIIHLFLKQHDSTTQSSVIHSVHFEINLKYNKSSKK